MEKSDIKYIEIPVTCEFDSKTIIGKLVIDECFLPTEPNYHFAIGGTIIEAENTPDGLLIKKFKLTQIAIMDDSHFMSYDTFKKNHLMKGMQSIIVNDH